MPIYDFECKQCGHQFEKLVLRSDAPAPACKACDGAEVVRLVSAPGFRLSGNGWYETDFKTGQKKESGRGERQQRLTRCRQYTEYWFIYPQACG